MATAAMILTVLSGVEHVWFFVLEAVLWRKPLGLKTFRMDAAKAEATAQLAVNQGFYNLLLAAGLFLGAFGGPAAHLVQLYALVFVVGAAVVGGITVNMRILLVQGVPAAIALGLLAIA